VTIGALRVKLYYPDNLSLKEKRGRLKSISARLRSRFNVAVAEIDDNEVWQLATLGISCVSNNGRHANQLLSKVMDFIEANRGDAQVLDYKLEIMHALNASERSIRFP